MWVLVWFCWFEGVCGVRAGAVLLLLRWVGGVGVGVVLLV